MIDKESHTAQMIRQDIEKALGVQTQTFLYADFPNEDQIDARCVDRISGAMKFKLAQKRNEGRGRWWDRRNCDQSVLSKMLREHVEKGDPLDVANFCMMLYCRGEKIL